MVLKSDKEKVKTLLSETIRLLCKNGLHFKTEFSVEALVGITLDREEEFFLSIKEIVKTDIPPPKPKPDVVRTPKEIRRSSVKEVKGEPKEMSPCPRKRPAETVTNNGSASDLPNLSLGDMQESEPTFWGSVTERDDGGGQVVKKKRTDPNDDDSNSNVITIKGEPGSDSDNDIECVGDSSDRDNTLDQSTMGDMSGSFMYGTPTSEQSMLGNMTTNMGQSWDQMPQFPMPGPSGMAQGGDVSQDSQQQQVLNFSMGMSQYVAETSAGKKGCSTELVVRNILLSKGKLSTPRIVTMNVRGKANTTEILHIMEQLDHEGVGYLVKNNPPPNFWSAAPPAKVKAVFLKRPAEEILPSLLKYNVNVHQYEYKFAMTAEGQESNYMWATHLLHSQRPATPPENDPPENAESPLPLVKVETEAESFEESY